MKNLIMNSLIILIFFTLTGCYYHRPIFSVRANKTVKVDSLSKTIKTEKEFYYLGIRRYPHLGRYGVYEEKSFNNDKIIIKKSKRIPAYMRDGYTRSFYICKEFDKSGKLKEKKKRIFQCQGRGGRTVVSKTIFYEKGKRTHKQSGI